MSRPRQCTVPGCDRPASPSHTHCGYHRRYPQPRPPRRALDLRELVETGMELDERNGRLVLLGGAELAAPPDLSQIYAYRKVAPGRLALMLPRRRMAHYLARVCAEEGRRA